LESPTSKQVCPNSADCWSPAMPAMGSSSPRNERGSVVAISPQDGTTSGSASRGTPNSEHSSSLQPPFSRSKSRVRDALETSVTCQVPRVIRAMR
jgi:hypothetical protein